LFTSTTIFPTFFLLQFSKLEKALQIQFTANSKSGSSTCFNQSSFLTASERLADTVKIFDCKYTFVVDGSEQPVPSSGHAFQNTEFFFQ
jgi:hypothetical protein